MTTTLTFDHIRSLVKEEITKLLSLPINEVDADTKYTVYAGYDTNGKLVYIGSTTQKPNVRFNHHRYTGKKLEFEVLKQFSSREEMVKYEQSMMDKHKPAQNKRKEALSNLPVTPEELKRRKSDPTWCKSCLRRHVNKGYEYCYNCERFGGAKK